MPTAEQTVRKFRDRLEDIRQLDSPVFKTKRSRYSIEDLKPGGFFRLNSKVYLVLERSRYEESSGEYEWFELKIRDVMTGQELFIEWEVDDELEIWLGEKVSLRFLPITASQLREIWEEDDDEASFKFQGETFFIEEWDDAKYFRGESGNGSPFRFFDFLNGAENQCVGLEIWGQEVEASFGKKVGGKAIEVLDLGGN